MTVADRCPGVLRPHRAEDGLVVRVRIPGGRTTGPVLRALSDLAVRHGNPDLQITSRGSVQLRGLSDPVPAALTGALRDLGLLPSPAHDRVRNIVASPFTGLRRRTADLTGMVADLDAAIVADPALAALSGRFLFALDDGSRDVSRLRFDLGYAANGRRAGAIMLGSEKDRIPVDASAAVPELLRLTRDFLATRAAGENPAVNQWHVADRPDWIRAHREEQQCIFSLPTEDPPLGAVAGAASVGVPLGLLTPDQARAAAAVAGDGGVVLTPWRGLVIPAAAGELDRLVDAGLIADPASGWALVSACVGAPHCARTSANTRAIATELVATGVAERVHVSGCGRRCGAPVGPHVDLVGELVKA